jgi:3-oxoacyl-[acyl-carrier protein] reductase
MNFTVEKKKALVTGGTGGIGTAVVKKLLSDGFRVVAFYHKNEKKAAELERAGAVLFRHDLADLSGIGVAAEAALDAADGKIDVLVNNHGISQFGLYGDLSDCDIVRMLNVNLTSAMLLTKRIVPTMTGTKSGKIINIGSVWGVYGGSCETHYSASKAGLIGFTKALAKELGLSGITVNCVCPGLIDTGMNGHLSEVEVQEFLGATALNRIGRPEEVAALISFLSGNQSDYITGQVICIDGGF